MDANLENLNRGMQQPSHHRCDVHREHLGKAER